MPEVTDQRPDPGEPEQKKPPQNEAFLTIILQVMVLVLFIPVGLIFKQIWLSVMAIPVVIFVNWGWAISRKSVGGLISLSLIGGASLSAFFVLLPEAIIPLKMRIVFAIASFSFGWFLIWYGSRIIKHKFWWWAFLPGMVILSGAMCVGVSKLEVLDFVFYLGGGAGLGLLIWGIGEKLLGLLIAGSLTLTTAPGIAFSFNYFVPSTVFSQIGIMLIWFAVGWGLVTVSSRVIQEKYIWWPLIPGGILSVVGMGLYFGGELVIAKAILGNTGALGVMIYAGYLILFRTRFHKS